MLTKIEDIILLPLPPPLFLEHLQYLSEYNLLYCRIHQYPLSLAGLDRYLRDQYRLSATIRKLLTTYCKTLGPLVDSQPITVLLPPDYSLVIPALRVYQNGFSYDNCRFLSISRSATLRHLNNAHSVYCSACKQYYSCVQLQSWYPGGCAHYWIVQNIGADSSSSNTLTEHPQRKDLYSAADIRSIILEELEQEEITRLAQLEEDSLTWDTEVEFSDTMLQLLHTKQLEYFTDRPLGILATIARQPAKFPIEDFVLGFQRSRLLESPLEAEIKIRAIVNLLDPMFEQCLRTLEASSYKVCCWIKSYDIDRMYPYLLKPLQRTTSRHSYIVLWKRFLSYVFQVQATPRNIRTEIYQLRLTDLQKDTISYIWAALDSCLGIQDRQDN